MPVQLEKTLKALANRRRLAILLLLKKNGERSVKDIADILNCSYKATSKHLARLRAVDLVECEQQRFEMVYRYSTSKNMLLSTVMKLY